VTLADYLARRERALDLRARWTTSGDFARHDHGGCPSYCYCARAALHWSRSMFGATARPRDRAPLRLP
jgi:hypothetical protein